MKDEIEVEVNKKDELSFAALGEINNDVENLTKNGKELDLVQHLSAAELVSVKDKLVASIQAVSLHLGQLLQERYALQEEVAGRHVTIAQLLRVQESRASQLGLQPAVQMSPAPRR